jgi:hypothetical protein
MFLKRVSLFWKKDTEREREREREKRKALPQREGPIWECDVKAHYT